MLVKNKKNIFKIATILLFCFFITACTAEDVKNKLEWLDQKAGESLEVMQQDQINKAINIMEETEEESDVATSTLEAAGLTTEQKEQIDQWLEENNLNRYGDAEDTIYAGGTPLFDEATGENIDRYDYILNNHSELINILN